MQNVATQKFLISYSKREMCVTALLKINKTHIYNACTCCNNKKLLIPTHTRI